MSSNTNIERSPYQESLNQNAHKLANRMAILDEDINTEIIIP